MAKFTFITFNIKARRNLLKSVVNYVGKKSHSTNVIVALQELPDVGYIKEMTIPDSVCLYSRAGLAFVFPKRINAVVNEIGVLSDDIASVRRNALLLALPFAKESLQIVNIHGYAQKEDGNLSKKKNKILFQNLEIFFGKCEKRIYLGDFNTNPYEENFLSSDVIYSSRERECVKDGRTSVNFYNPIWRYLKEKKGVLGTYYNKKYSPRWQILDHILISKKMCECAIKSFNILDGFSDIKIDLKKFKKDTVPPECSDHLPVSITMEI